MPLKGRKTKTQGKTTKPDRLEASNGDNSDPPTSDTGHSRPVNPDSGLTQHSETLADSEEPQKVVGNNIPQRRQSSMLTVPDSTIGFVENVPSKNEMSDMAPVDDNSYKGEESPI